MKKFLTFFSVIVFLLLWQFAAVKINSSLILPDLVQVFKALLLLLQSKDFYITLFNTLNRIFQCFLVSVIAGSFTGFLCGKNQNVKAFFNFPLTILKTTPVVALILILIFVFKSTVVPQISGIILTLPVITDSVSSAFSKDEKTLGLERMADVFNLNCFQKFSYITFPQIFPVFAGAVKSVFALSWKVIIAGEVLSLSEKSLGRLLSESQVHLESQTVFALVLFIVLFSFILEFLLSAALKQIEMLVKKGALEFFCKNNKSELKEISGGICVTYLNVSFGSRRVFENFSFSMKDGDFKSIIAPSGSGKTTLLRHISSIYECSFVFQEPLLIEFLTVEENILLPVKNLYSKEKCNVLLENVLKSLHLTEQKNQPASTLSGGQKQRTALARSLIYPSRLLLLDEPFSSIDYDLKLKIMDYLKEEFHKSQKTVLLVTHDVRDARYLGCEIITL